MQLSAKERLLRPVLLLFTAALAGCGDSKGPSGGAIPFDQQVAQAQQERAPELRAEKLIQIALAQSAAQDVFGAEKTLKLAEQSCREIGDPATQAGLFGRLAEAQVGISRRYEAAGSIAAALEAARKIESPESRARTLARLARTQGAAETASAAARTLQQSEELGAEISDPLQRVLVLAAAAESFHAIGRAADAERVLTTALELARSIEDQRIRCRALAEVAAAQQGTENAAAKATFDEAVQASRAADDLYASALLLCEIAEKLSQVGLAERAHELLGEAGRIADRIPEIDLQKQVSERVRTLKSRLPRPGGG